MLELVSPGSVRHDTVTKFDAYARGGIEHFWMVDTRPDYQRFTAFRLVDGRYDAVAESDERIDVEEPAVVSLELESLFRTQ